MRSFCPRPASVVLGLSIIVSGVFAIAGSASPSGASTSAACPGQSPYNSGVGTGNASKRPVILVHGWDGSSTSMDAIASAIEIDPSISSQVSVKFFDYRSAASRWASVPAIAGCLGEYITAMSNSYKAAGGDGKVIVIAHSMGGLAARFASQGAYTNDPIAADVADLISIDTPYLGSPLGGSLAANIAEAAHNLDSIDFPFDTDGATCLATHSPPANTLPHGCALAPYLSADTGVDQIAGDAQVERTLFGIHLYTVDLQGDGIVPVSSSQGYSASGPGGAPPSGSTDLSKTVFCTVTSDQIVSAISSKVGYGPIGATLGVLAGLPIGLDSSAFRDLLGGSNGPAFLDLLAIVEKLAPCSHSGMLTDSLSLDDVLSYLAQDLNSFQSVTRKATPNFSAFVGTWNIPSESLTISASGSGTYQLPDYAECPTCIVAQIPPDTIIFQLESVTGGEATGTIISSTDVVGVSKTSGALIPAAYQPGSTITLTLESGSQIQVATSGGAIDELCSASLCA